MSVPVEKAVVSDSKSTGITVVAWSETEVYDNALLWKRRNAVYESTNTDQSLWTPGKPWKTYFKQAEKAGIKDVRHGISTARKFDQAQAARDRASAGEQENITKKSRNEE